MGFRDRGTRTPGDWQLASQYLGCRRWPSRVVLLNALWCSTRSSGVSIKPRVATLNPRHARCSALPGVASSGDEEAHAHMCRARGRACTAASTASDTLPAAMHLIGVSIGKRVRVEYREHIAPCKVSGDNCMKTDKQIRRKNTQEI